MLLVFLIFFTALMATFLFDFINGNLLRSIHNRRLPFHIDTFIPTFMNENDLSHIPVERKDISLTDTHFDKHEHKIVLSKDLYHRPSILSLWFFIHEAFHGIQKEKRFLPFTIRSHDKMIFLMGLLKLLLILLSLYILGSYLLSLLGVDLTPGHYTYPSVLLAFVYLSIVFLSLSTTFIYETHANINTYRYIKEKKLIPKNDLKKLKSVGLSSSLTYFFTSFLLIQ